jgi:hypothetical protein
MRVRVFTFLFISCVANALPNSTSIVALDTAPGEVPLAYLSDGSVREIPPDSQARILKQIRTRLNGHQPGVLPESPLVYEGDTLAPDLMQRWFTSMNRKTRYRAQCYNRAHVWAYEADRGLGIRSEKIFMFFSSRYIREYHYRWWFHVAPLTRVVTPEGPEERVMDPGFFKKPVSVKEWSDDFIKPRTPCKRVSRYSDYASVPHTEYCYFMVAPMFMWQPKDLEAVDRGEPVKERFESFDIETAYRQAFR